MTYYKLTEIFAAIICALATMQIIQVILWLFNHVSINLN